MLRDITLPIEGFEFEMTHNDWEYASDPICMELVTEEEWDSTAKALTKVMKYAVDSMDSDTLSDEYALDELDDLFWCEYEKLVVRNCTTFYYEDMTDSEYDSYMDAATDGEKLEIARNVYNRLNNL